MEIKANSVFKLSLTCSCIIFLWNQVPYILYTSSLITGYLGVTDSGEMDALLFEAAKSKICAAWKSMNRFLSQLENQFKTGISKTTSCWASAA